MHRFALHNDEICEVSGKLLSPGQIGLFSGWGVFTTIRVAGGVLFAWQRHWDRMKRDAALMRVPFPDDQDAVHSRLLKLVQANEANTATMRIIILRNRGGMWEGPQLKRDFDLIAFTTDIKDWGAGVRLAVTPQARHASCMFAGTKILSWAMNLAWLEEAQARGFDEVILLNERGEVSECTSANIFAAEGSRVWTPPLRSGCLPGVTRDLLLNEIRIPGIKVGEKDLRLTDLEKADEVFITSTTRDLLPVISIESMEVRMVPGPRIALEKAFAAYLSNYVTSHKEVLLSPQKS
jgi:branched-chain amino acid aminotransferase